MRFGTFKNRPTSMEQEPERSVHDQKASLSNLYENKRHLDQVFFLLRLPWFHDYTHVKIQSIN